MHFISPKFTTEKRSLEEISKSVQYQLLILESLYTTPSFISFDKIQTLVRQIRLRLVKPMYFSIFCDKHNWISLFLSLKCSQINYLRASGVKHFEPGLT